MTNAPRDGRGALQVTAGQVVSASVSRESDTTPRLRLVRSAPTAGPEPNPAAIEAYLAELIGRYDGDVPMIDELAAEDLGRPRGTAAIAKAALVWLRHKSPDVIRADLERELAEDNRLAAWRLRRMSGDLAGAPWPRLHEVARARAEYGDRRYRREPD